MPENKIEKIGSAVEKVVSQQSTRIESALGELNKLQSKGLEQFSAMLESMTRAAKEQVAFAEQMGGEWRKLILASTRNVAEHFAPKA